MIGLINRYRVPCEYSILGITSETTLLQKIYCISEVTDHFRIKSVSNIKSHTVPN